MPISFRKVIPIGILFLAVPVFASVHPKTGSSKKHYHASVTAVSVKHKKGFHLMPRHEEKAPVEMPSERATQIQTALIEPKIRKKTRPTRASKERRIDSKKRRSSTKRERGGRWD